MLQQFCLQSRVLRPLQVVLLFLVRGIPLLCAGGRYISNTINNEKEVIASIFARATSQTNCSTVLPSSPICSIFHGIKRLCLERQNTLTINHAEFEPPQGGRHIIRELVSVHVHYTWMLINWNSPKGCGRRTRNRSTTWSGLMHSKIFMNIIILWVQFLLYRYIVHDVVVYLLHVWFLGFS